MSVQGDGIHVLELSNMHASVSHTLGPSAFFAAPAVTRFESSGASTSYAVMQSAPDGVDAKERGRTVWRWRDHQSKRPEELPEPKRSVVFPQLVQDIWAPSALPSHVVAVSPSGQIMLADQDLNLISNSAVPDPGNILLRSWLFRSEECTFLPRGDHSSGIVILCFILNSNRLKLRIHLMQPIEELKELAECDMGLHKDVTDISCDPSGYTSVLTPKGGWDFFCLGHDHAGTVTATPLSEPLHLSGFSSDSSSSQRMNGPTLLSVGSSHVLFAGITSGSLPEISLLLWDLQYSIVLASQTVAMPSTMPYNPKHPPSLELVPASRTQAILVMSPAVLTDSPRKGGAAQSRSTVFVVPLEVPSVSTIALAMGKARDTQKWLQSIHNPSSIMEHDEVRSQMMRSVRSAIEQGRPQAAETAFFTWVEEETIRLKQAQEELSAEDDEILPTDDLENPEKARKVSKVKKMRKKVPTKPILSHHWVSSMLNMILQPTKPSEAIYSSKIVFYLVDRKAVGHAMVEGGLVPALRSHRDWESIYSALRNVSDIPETDLVGLLAEVVASHRRQREPPQNSAQVNAPTNIPPLAQFLAALVNYTTSPPVLRLALKHRLTDVNDVLCVIEVLERWVVRWCGKSLDLAPPLEISVPGVSQPVRKKKVRPALNDGMPPFENVMSFLQSILDTHFLVLLQYSACHDIIERLTQCLKQLLVSVDEMDRLRGPLESFIRAEAKEARLRSSRKEGEEDWRKKRKEAVHAAELAVGLYQVEELVI